MLLHNFVLYDMFRLNGIYLTGENREMHLSSPEGISTCANINVNIRLAKIKCICHFGNSTPKSH